MLKVNIIFLNLSEPNPYLFFRNHKDLALVSLANILHQSKYSLDAAILMHAALEITNDYDIVYFTLGNIYGVRFSIFCNL